MSRTMLELEQELAAMWQLVNELSEQLATNRQLTETLQIQAKDLKGQAVHSGTGFPLRRFNIDISDEQFTSELESFASHLVLENQSLQFENKQLNLLLKEYEGTLEGVMAKFRAVSHAASQHELTLHQYYTSLLHQLRTAYSTSTLLDNNTLSTLLERLSTLLRAALRSENGEQPFDSNLPEDLAALLGSSSSTSPTSATHPLLISGIPSSTSTRSKAWLGDLGTSGGYSGTEGRADWALEREAEITRLNEENKLLRDMLGIGEEISEDKNEKEEKKGKKVEEEKEDEEGKVEEGKPSPTPVVETIIPSGSSTSGTTSIFPSISNSLPPTSTPYTNPPTTSSNLSNPFIFGSLASTQQPQPVEMARSISSPPATLDSTTFLSSITNTTSDSQTQTQTQQPHSPNQPSSSTPTSPSVSRTRSPIRTNGRVGGIISPPPALSPPIIKTPIPLPTLGHAAGESISPLNSTLNNSIATSPTNPLSSIFLKPSTTTASSSSSSSSSSNSISPSSSISSGLSTIPGISNKRTKTEPTTAMSGGGGGGSNGSGSSGGLAMLDGMEGRGLEEKGRSMVGFTIGSGGGMNSTSSNTSKSLNLNESTKVIGDSTGKKNEKKGDSKLEMKKKKIDGNEEDKIEESLIRSISTSSAPSLSSASASSSTSSTSPTSSTSTTDPKEETESTTTTNHKGKSTQSSDPPNTLIEISESANPKGITSPIEPKEDISIQDAAISKTISSSSSTSPPASTTSSSSTDMKAPITPIVGQVGRFEDGVDVGVGGISSPEQPKDISKPLEERISDKEGNMTSGSPMIPLIPTSPTSPSREDTEIK